jgi:hypothetical protein
VHEPIGDILSIRDCTGSETLVSGRKEKSWVVKEITHQGLLEWEKVRDARAFPKTAAHFTKETADSPRDPAGNITITRRPVRFNIKISIFLVCTRRNRCVELRPRSKNHFNEEVTFEALNPSDNILLLGCLGHTDKLVSESHKESSFGGGGLVFHEVMEGHICRNG